MKNTCKRLLVGAFIFAIALPLLAKPEPTEEQLIANLASPTAKVVFAALQDLEKKFPTSAPAQAKIKTLLTDPRQNIREKAARVLGALHAEVSEADLKSIAADFLQVDDQGNTMRGSISILRPGKMRVNYAPPSKDFMNRPRSSSTPTSP